MRSDKRFRQARWAAGCALMFASMACVLSVGCGDGARSGSANLGVEGASCTSSLQCMPPLQCMGLVCTAVASDVVGSDDSGGVAEVPDTALSDSRFDNDLPLVTEIPEYVDLWSWELTDPDVPGTEDPGPQHDGSLGWETIYSDCETLGIGPDWEGTFFGAIEYDLDDPFDLIYPDAGTMPVEGDLEFSIECIDSKLVVNGTMSGWATVEGQGDFPFELTLVGFYSPSQGKLTAQMVEGVVTIYGFVHVSFEGNFQGDLRPDGSFEGTWDGEATKTNADGLINGEASGQGIWAAHEKP